MSYGDCEAAIAYIDRISANCAALANGDFPADIPPIMKQEAIDGLKNMLRNAMAGMFELRLRAVYVNCHKEFAGQASGTASLGGMDLEKVLEDAQAHFAHNKGATATALEGTIAEARTSCADVDAGIASVMNNA